MEGIERGGRIRRQVLVVDDEPVNREMLGYILSSEYDVSFACDGQQALDMIRENGMLSAVMLDLMMPVMTGLELLEILKADPSFKVPVIVLTSDRTAEVKALGLGASDYIKKPYDAPEVILARVRRIIELFEDRGVIRSVERDALTGLYTREFFFEYARRIRQYFPDREIDAAVLNINHFRLVNEMRGREFGDSVLRRIAGILREYVLARNGIACRSEADRFYFYCTHQDEYQSLQQQITDSLNGMSETSRIRIRLGVCSGRCGDETDIEQQFDNARNACNSLRDAFSGQVAYYDDAMHESEIEEERLLNQVERALDSGQFRVFFQPKYDIRGDRPHLTSAEALIRWEHPEKGMISPGGFISLFERNSLIQKLDHFVWTETARNIRRWKERFGVSIPVSVNVSRVDLFEDGICDTILGILVDNGLDGSDIFLEITESAYTKDTEMVLGTVRRFRDAGLKIELDDFGTGYSALNMISSMPVDILKLDKEFITDLKEDGDRAMKLVELILGIARYLQVPMVVEGVETEEQYRLLKKAGCDVIQGYYFSKPLPPEQFEQLIGESMDR